MGGHGGLNILPQKSWHVYNFENREKVKRDEAKFEAEEKEKRARHCQAESQYRHAALLVRVRGQPQDDSLLSAAPAGAAASPSNVMPSDARVWQPEHKPQHINFWREDELKAGNAEVKADEKQQRRLRGRAETQTSDPSFDERFKLGHAMHGAAHTPWYARAAALADVPEPPSVRVGDGAAMLGSAAQPAAALEIKPAERPSNRSKPKLEKQKRKHKQKDREKRQDRHPHTKAQQLKASLKLLRAERESREAGEAARQRQLLSAQLRGS